MVGSSALQTTAFLRLRSELSQCLQPGDQIIGLAPGSTQVVCFMSFNVLIHLKSEHLFFLIKSISHSSITIIIIVEKFRGAEQIKKRNLVIFRSWKYIFIIECG